MRKSGSSSISLDALLRRGNMKRNTSQGIALEQMGDSGADSSLIPPQYPIDPQLEQIMAADRERKAKRRRQICIAVTMATIVTFLVLAATTSVGYWFFFYDDGSSSNGTSAESFETDDPVVVAEELRRVNCYPEQDGSPFESWHISKADCEKRGCIYKKPRTNANMPICFIPPAGIGYRQVDVRQRTTPQRTTEYVLRRLNPSGIFGTMVDGLNMEVTELSDSIIRIHIAPEKGEKPTTSSGQANFDLGNENLINTGTEFFAPDPDLKTKYKFNVISENPFAYRIARADQETGTVHENAPVMWNTEIGGLIFTGDFIQLTGLVPRNSRVYGIGEHRHETFRREHRYMAQTWSLFARNQPPDWMTETHLYGAHPFMMVVDPSGLTHGILFYNAAPAEITINPYPQIAWRAVAGVADMFLFVGPSPDQVIQQYTQLVGRPALPPRWFFDLHVCFNDIETLTDLERLIVEWEQRKLPWGTLCVRQNGIKRRYEAFSSNFDDMMFRWRRSLYNTNKHLSYAVLPHISTQNRIVTSDVLLGRAVENAVKQLSCIMPSDAVKQTFYLYKHGEYGAAQQSFAFWDPLARDVTTAYRNYLAPKWRTTDFHVLELVENQPFVNNRDKNVSTSTCLNYELPYTTRAGYFQYSSSATLSRATVCALSLHRDCTIPHVDVHNAYGFLMAKTANEAWMRLMSQARQALNKRSNTAPIMSSSTFPGYGKIGGHWLGQTAATWLSLTASVMAMLEFNWFGIPVVGDSLCGEEGPGSLELCIAWANLATFQAAVRYDYDPQGRPQFHSLWNDPNYYQALNRSLVFRKNLMPYLFSQLYEFSQNGIPFWKPLFHLSPADQSLINEYHSFMVGDGLLVAPILTPPATQDGRTRVQLIPQYKWLHLRTNREYDFCHGAENNGRIWRQVPSLKTESPENYVFLKGGAIVPIDTEALTTFNITIPPETRGRKITLVDYGAMHITLLVSEDCDQRRTKGKPLARGSFFWEGGVNDTSSIHVSFSLSQYYVLEGRLTFTPPRVLHSHLPPNVPRPPTLPWPFEVVIDHILFFGIDTSRLLELKQPPHQAVNGSSGNKTATALNMQSIANNEVKVDVKQAVAGDTAVVSTREAIAINDADKHILHAARISIPLSEGDFSVVLVPRTRQQS